jgi:hypothetical protein
MARVFTIITAALLAACDGPSPPPAAPSSATSSGGAATVQCAASEIAVTVHSSGGTPGGARNDERTECLTERQYASTYAASEHCVRAGQRARCEAHYPSAPPP